MKRLLLISSFLFVFGCNNNKLELKEYLKYYSSNKAFETIEYIDSFEVKARVLTKEYIGLIGLGPEVLELPTFYIDSVLSLTENYTYVFLDFKNKMVAVDALYWSCGDSISLASRINYLNESFHKSVVLISENDTIKCNVSQLERTYNLTDKTRIILGFEGGFDKLKDPLQLVLNEKNKLSHKKISLSFKDFKRNKIVKLDL